MVRIVLVCIGNVSPWVFLDHALLNVGKFPFLIYIYVFPADAYNSDI